MDLNKKSSLFKNITTIPSVYAESINDSPSIQLNIESAVTFPQLSYIYKFFYSLNWDPNKVHTLWWINISLKSLLIYWSLSQPLTLFLQIFVEELGLFFLVNLLQVGFCWLYSHGIIYHVLLSLVFLINEKSRGSLRFKLNISGKNTLLMVLWISIRRT